MEYSIDRSSYRRHANEEVADSNDKKIIYKIIKRLLIQSIAGIIVLITIYTFKAMKIENVIEWLKNETNKNMSFETAYTEFKTVFRNLYESVYELTNVDGKKEKDKINAGIVENEVADTTLSLSTDEPTKTIYEEAVEGINQMSDDAKYINDNYTLIHPIYGTVTSRFGVRKSDNPIVTSYHSGIDIAANQGTKIKAALSGEVIKSTTNEAYGKYIMIKTDDVITVYAHCSRLIVKEGEKVKQGDIIAEVGSTGWATGPHLHFEIRLNDRLVNPDNILDFGE